MTAAQQAIFIGQNETFSLSLIWKDSSQALVDVTGYEALLQVRQATGAPVLLQASSYSAAGDTPSCAITLGGVTGSVIVDIPQAVTTSLVFPEADCKYSLEMKSPSGEYSTLLYGSCSLVPEITEWV